MTRSTSGSPRLVGSEKARLFTPPLRRLSRKTSRGYEVVDFAEQVLGLELLPWERWLLIRALELDPSGGFRFRVIVLLVARQNGKTLIWIVVALWRLFVDDARLVVGTAQDLDIARDVWNEAIELAEAAAETAAELTKISRTNGNEYFKVASGGRYRIKAANRAAGRGPSVDLLGLDELREQRDWQAWGALSKTTMAREFAQIWALSSAGDNTAVVLNQLRDAALSGRDPSIGLFEWSGADGCDLEDRRAWAQANPGLGFIISEQAIASALGTDPPDVFRTEVLCQQVDALATAIDLGGWRACGDAGGNLDGLRDRVAFCVDVAEDGEHVTLAAAAAADSGRVRVELVKAWTSDGDGTATEKARRELPGLVETGEPAQLGWFPSGPAAELGVELRGLRAPAAVAARYRADSKWRFVREIKGGEVPEACQELDGLVKARQLLHSEDPLLNAHVSASRRLLQGDGWRFVRRGAGHVDAAYAAAGAVRVARTLPEVPELVRPMVLVGRAQEG